MSETKPRLWSDFDGTAVKLVKNRPSRTWLHYPFVGLRGYVEFLEGVASAGVEIAGIVTRRPNICVGRLATEHSISRFRYNEIFEDPSKIILAGSEVAKGQFVADQSRHATVGMLEDRPHRLGSAMLSSLLASEDHPRSRFPIIMGVVSHPNSHFHIRKLTHQARRIAQEVGSDLEIAHAQIGATPHVTFRTESVALEVVQLQPYSKQTGYEFGATLLEAA